MAAIDLGQLFGGKQFLANVSVNSGGVPSASSGTLLSISGSGGNRVRLDMLVASSGSESDIRITVDGVNVWTGAISTITAGGTVVSQSSGSETNSGNLRNVITDIVGYNIVVSKVSGSTSNALSYQWSEGS